MLARGRPSPPGLSAGGLPGRIAGGGGGGGGGYLWPPGGFRICGTSVKFSYPFILPSGGFRWARARPGRGRRAGAGPKAGLRICARGGHPPPPGVRICGTSVKFSCTFILRLRGAGGAKARPGRAEGGGRALPGASAGSRGRERAGKAIARAPWMRGGRLAQAVAAAARPRVQREGVGEGAGRSASSASGGAETGQGRRCKTEARGVGHAKNKSPRPIRGLSG